MDNINKENELIEVKENEIVTAESITTKIKVIINHVQKTAIEGAIEIGIELKKLKELVAHGEWEKYIADNLDFSSRKAREFMQLADKYSDKDSEYFIAISKRRIYADLSVSNALALLTVPEDEVENFTENVEVENLKVDELKSEIKKLKEKIESGDNEQKSIIEELEKEKAKNEKLRKDLGEEKSILEIKLKAAEEKLNNKESDSEEKIKKNSNSDALAKKKEEIKNLKEEIKILKDSIEESNKKTDELREEISQQKSRIEDVQKKAAEEVAKSKKKAKIGSNESAVKIKIQIDILQEAFNKAEEEIKKMEESDREKFKGAVKNLLEKLHNRL